MSEIRKIAHNTIIQVVGKAVTVAIALLGFGLVARYLGQEGFGYYSTIYAFLSIFGILIDLGLQMTTTKLISDPKENEGQILSNALTIRLTASLIFLGLAPLLVLFFPYPNLIKIGVAVAAVGFIFASLVATITSFFQKYLLMHKIVVAEIVAKILFLIAVIATVYFNIGLLGIVGAIVLDSFFSFALLFYFASKKLPLKLSFDFIAWQKILGQTWPIALTIALNLIYFKGDILIMSLIRTQSEVGLYGAPYKILEVLINMVYLFLGLLLPIMAAAVAANNLPKLKKVIQSAFDFLIILGVPLIVGGLFLGRSLMVFMAGPQFAVSGQIIKILLLATVIIFISGLFGYAVVALNQQKRMIKFYAVNAVVSIVGYLILIHYYSYWGAAAMTVFTETFILITACYVMSKSLKFLPQIKIVLKSIVASAVMAIPLYFLPNVNFAILIGGGAIIYFLALYVFKGFDKQIILEITKIKN